MVREVTHYEEKWISNYESIGWFGKTFNRLYDSCYYYGAYRSSVCRFYHGVWRICNSSYITS